MTAQQAYKQYEKLLTGISLWKKEDEQLHKIGAKWMVEAICSLRSNGYRVKNLSPVVVEGLEGYQEKLIDWHQEQTREEQEQQEIKRLQEEWYASKQSLSIKAL